MNRQGQDFKVWERDDYSFLRWYITRIMETHIIQAILHLPQSTSDL
jgi:hypothetical protein